MTLTVLRFFGREANVLAANDEAVFVYGLDGTQRYRVSCPSLIDAIIVGDEIRVACPGRIVRLALGDGRLIGVEPFALDPAGAFLQSHSVPSPIVWRAAESSAIVFEEDARTEVYPEPSADLPLPVGDGRWLLWRGGQLRSWRRGEVQWSRPLGEPAAPAIGAQVVLDGRVYVLFQQTDEGLRVLAASTRDGAPTAHLRAMGGTQFYVPSQGAVVAVRAADNVHLLDVRFGRHVRDLPIPEGVVRFAIDATCRQIALGFADGIEVVALDELERVAPASSSASALRWVQEPVESVKAAAAPLDDNRPWPTDPLVRLDPIERGNVARRDEAARALELGLDLVTARAYLAIAQAWDSGRLIKPDPNRPPFIDEVSGLLGLTNGLAIPELVSARENLAGVVERIEAAAREREGRPTPLDTIASRFSLTRTACDVLLALLGPRLRGELARLYGILCNDPARPLVDEYLLHQLLGTDLQTVSGELDAERPLRRFGIVHVGNGERPFAALTVDATIIRMLANQAIEREHDPLIKLRAADRTLDELEMPRRLVRDLLAELSYDRDEPVRIVVRGRMGSGRHALLAAIAATAGRTLGVIDISGISRHPHGNLATTLEAALLRAHVRGLVPCIDGLEHITPESDDKLAVTAVLEAHRGPIGIRLPIGAVAPLPPGYSLVDLPERDEGQRTKSWELAFHRYGIDADGSEMAARYRIGPGIIDVVCAKVAARPAPPRTHQEWLAELDAAVRQHLENRLGAIATRVTRLATWSDVVLPEDVLYALLGLSARVRHRRTVYEKWGFDRSITTARGITALFMGSPGTGKTMVAGVIARDLGLELYRVDVARITSKWIGETEKNLASLFDAAEDGQVMLLFDEADSLFAKRTQVRSSVDRYANMEVNYLLQRLDTFEGVAILSTNFGAAIDPAFKRRLTYRVTFPFPDEEMRERLWRTMIPPQLPIDGPLDFAELGKRYRLSGGYIRNAVLRSAFLAAEEGTAVTQAHLERAISLEYREMGKLAESGTLE